MKGKTILIAVVGSIVALAIIALMIFSWVMGLRNTLVGLEESTKGSWAQVETQLQRRYDLIPNLVETVKGYAAHEEGVLVDVTRARASVGGAQTPEQKMEANNQLSGALARLLVVTENYPNLKANTNFIALQDELAGTENRISVSRQRYNELVQQYNGKLRIWPYTLMSATFKPATYFDAAEGAAQAPKVSFEKK